MQHILFKIIDQPNIWGLEATIDNRTAEVVEAYEGQWLTFCYIDNVMQRGGPAYKSYREAKLDAAVFPRQSQ